ncbi:hypothetical protein HCCG_00361 [Helicobacter cinaedi CCUG 18818 = ATCC BAA-847]|uniref:Uncharacterized protein n=1 Tax=Helicobacter cinaedi CCUG 18818 = ATCC BAA-847 TaxID=537971 RepID=A0ABN0B9K3_9HELI|nr:hypothetical protein HCCG_00361 [Helicobacter cinaedi CCUG 18818 = ATCC BAA-847]
MTLFSFVCFIIAFYHIFTSFSLFLLPQHHAFYALFLEGFDKRFYKVKMIFPKPYKSNQD